MTTAQALRREHDLVGNRELPAEARHGIHALRAAENFARPGAQLLRDVPDLCRAFGMVKLAAQRANVESGGLSMRLGRGIGNAARELIDDAGGLRDELIVPLVQGGAGTSSNMNVNEVLANRTLERLGHHPGEYQYCDPNDHVNRSQSTNDVYPTALRLALILGARKLERAATRLDSALRDVAGEHAETVKLGRTQLQDAVAMSVGDEFEAWADAVAAARTSLIDHRDALLEVNLGGTAIGTGLTASADYRERVVPILGQVSGIPVRAAAHALSATTDPGALHGYSASLRGLAVVLGKLANDLRLLSSGPHGGLAELHLPAVQGGSSMMPGKVNPVIAEFVNQIAFRVRGADAAVTAALDAGQLQLNAMLPLVAAELLGAQRDLTCAMDTLRIRCIRGIAIDSARSIDFAQHSLGELTTIAAREGYAVATYAAKLRDGAPPAPVAPALHPHLTKPQADDRLRTEREEDRCHN